MTPASSDTRKEESFENVADDDHDDEDDFELWPDGPCCWDSPLVSQSCTYLHMLIIFAVMINFIVGAIVPYPVVPKVAKVLVVCEVRCRVVLALLAFGAVFVAVSLYYAHSLITDSDNVLHQMAQRLKHQPTMKGDLSELPLHDDDVKTVYDQFHEETLAKTRCRLYVLLGDCALNFIGIFCLGYDFTRSEWKQPLTSVDVFVGFFFVLIPLCYLRWITGTCAIAFQATVFWCKAEVRDFLHNVIGYMDVGKFERKSSWIHINEECGKKFAVEKKFVAEGFWVELIRKHRNLDRRLEQMCSGDSFYLLSSYLVALVLGTATTGIMVHAVASIFFKCACLSVAFVILANCLYMDLLGPARVTEVCASRVGNVTSIVNVTADFFGAPNMSKDVRWEHSTFMQFLYANTAGFKVPMFGLVTMSKLVFAAKSLAVLFPALLTVFLSATGDDAKSAS